MHGQQQRSNQSAHRQSQINTSSEGQDSEQMRRFSNIVRYDTVDVKQSLLNEVKMLRADGDFHGAVEAIGEIQRSFQDDFEVLFESSENYLRNSLFKEATHLYKRALSVALSFSQHSDSQLQLSFCYFNRGKVNLALKQLQKMFAKKRLMNQSTIDQIRYQIGLCYMARGRFKKALNEFQSIMVKRPNHFALLFMRGNAFFQMQMYKAAINCYNSAAFRMNDNIDLLVMKGKAHYNLEEYEKAKISFQNALDIDPASCQHLRVDLTLIKVRSAANESKDKNQVTCKKATVDN